MGVASSLLYSIRDAFQSIRENITTTALTSVTIGFSLAIFTLFLIVFVNLNKVIKTWGDRTHIVVYIDDRVSRDTIKGLERKILTVEGVDEIRFISKEMAFEELKEELKGHEGILEGVDKDTLPASFEIRIEESYMEPNKVRYMVERLRRLEGVEEVQYGSEWVERFSAFLNFIELSALIVGLFLAVATIFIISNTIRLTVYARKDEIEIMRLVGASNLFIKIPFFIEGVCYGLMGGVMATGMLFAGKYLLTLKIPSYFHFVVELPFSVSTLLFMLVLSGIFMGVVGSLLSLGRFLRI